MNDTMLIETYNEIPKGKRFACFGDNKNFLSVNDLVYIWVEKDRGGLGAEIIYGTGRIIFTDGNGYIVERIK